MQGPDPEEVRATLSRLDVRERKIVGGLVAVMMGHADRIRDREWIAEQLTQVTLLAGGFEADAMTDGVETVRLFLQERSAELLRTSFLLFHRVGADMGPRVEAGFTFEEAMKQAMTYFTSAEPTGE